jgi:hypothetical protein
MEVNIKLVKTTWMDMMEIQIQDTNFTAAYFMDVQNVNRCSTYKKNKLFEIISFKFRRNFGMRIGFLGEIK